MSFPVDLPVKPMLAKLATAIPTGEAPGGAGWLYEPKWDGFRCIVARDGDAIELASRKERPFTRYFPELLDPLRDALPPKAIVDGEIVIPDSDGHGLDFDALLQRIHPAESRVRRLAAETPAVFVAFDLLALGDESWLERPLNDRRAELQRILATNAAVFMTPASSDPDVAAQWFSRFEGAGLDGIVAKPAGEAYQPDKRALVKVKHQRTAECVLAGFRVHKDRQGVGSMLLGLYDDDGRLHHVGVAASFTAKYRRELLEELTPLTEGANDDHPWGEWASMQQPLANALDPDAAPPQRMPGATSRWNAGKDLSWVPVRAERVVEVTFGQLENGRFRHGVSFVRWRPDREPSSCRYDQLDVADPVSFYELVGAAG
ncbi:ATP-dependent DNA ligase [Desertimonas flava]|jgi:ATP-dependent DNA ligase|uniref:ATP-dependent DNA ligase n=1 Tax=Desertimonas flava TaxID=2064846 RepID=UPI000E3568A8|nr:ATP-dependent DNA ligase [Desertimonas flava]